MMPTKEKIALATKITAMANIVILKRMVMEKESGKLEKMSCANAFD